MAPKPSKRKERAKLMVAVTIAEPPAIGTWLKHRLTGEYWCFLGVENGKVIALKYGGACELSFPASVFDYWPVTT